MADKKYDNIFYMVLIVLYLRSALKYCGLGIPDAI